MSTMTMTRDRQASEAHSGPSVAHRRRRRERNQLVSREMKLADKIAYDYRNKGVDFDDLKQVAYLALTKAADRYDESRGTRFSVYASVSINGELKRYFRDHGWSVRPPRSLQELYLTLRSVNDQATQRLARTPTVDELADHADVDREDVLAAMSAHAGYRSQSIDVPADADHPGRGYEPVEDEPGFDRVCDQVDIGRLLNSLSSRERHILDLRYKDGLTQAAIADEIGVSQVQVSRLLAKILDKMRAELDRADEVCADEVCSN